MAFCLPRQREVVARHRNLDPIPDPCLFMPFAGTAALDLAQYGDAVACALGRVVPQREVTHQLVTDPHRDMRPGFERRQIAAMWVHQLVAVDSLGETGDRP